MGRNIVPNDGVFYSSINLTSGKGPEKRTRPVAIGARSGIPGSPDEVAARCEVTFCTAYCSLRRDDSCTSPPAGQRCAAVTKRKKKKNRKRRNASVARDIDHVTRHDFDRSIEIVEADAEGKHRPCTAPTASGSFRWRPCPRFAKAARGPRSLCSRLDLPIVEGRAGWPIPADSDTWPRKLPAPRPCKGSRATCGMCTPVPRERLSVGRENR